MQTHENSRPLTDTEVWKIKKRKRRIKVAADIPKRRRGHLSSGEYGTVQIIEQEEDASLIAEEAVPLKIQLPAENPQINALQIGSNITSSGSGFFKDRRKDQKIIHEH